MCLPLNHKSNNIIKVDNNLMSAMEELHSKQSWIICPRLSDTGETSSCEVSDIAHPMASMSRPNWNTALPIQTEQLQYNL